MNRTDPDGSSNRRSDSDGDGPAARWHAHGATGRAARRTQLLPPRLGARCDRAEPAAVFDALLVRPSRSTFEAAFAALGLVFREATIVDLLVVRSTLYASSRGLLGDRDR